MSGPMTSGEYLDLMRLRSQLIEQQSIYARSKESGVAKPGVRRQQRREKRAALLKRREIEQEIVRFVLALKEAP